MSEWPQQHSEQEPPQFECRNRIQRDEAARRPKRSSEEASEHRAHELGNVMVLVGVHDTSNNTRMKTNLFPHVKVALKNTEWRTLAHPDGSIIAQQYGSPEAGSEHVVFVLKTWKHQRADTHHGFFGCLKLVKFWSLEVVCRTDIGVNSRIHEILVVDPGHEQDSSNLSGSFQ